MVLVGNSWVLFLSGGELSYRDQWSWWAIIVGFYFYPVGSCPIGISGPGGQ